METSLRYGGDSKSLRIHAKEKLPISSNVFFQLQGELDTRVGAPTHLHAMIRFFYPDVLQSSFGLGVECNRHGKLQYGLRGKKLFPVTSDGLLNFTVKGQCSMPENFREVKYKGGAEFVWNIFSIKKDQDLRLKFGYDVLEQIPYVQVRENNWAFNADGNRRWTIKYDL